MTSPAHGPDDQLPDGTHGDPLLNAVQGSGDVEGTRHGATPRETSPEDASPDQREAAGDPPDAPGVGGDARLHDLGGEIGPTSPSSRGGGGLGPAEVREADERAARDRTAD